MAADTHVERALDISGWSGCAATSQWRDVVERDDLDAVIVSTTNDWLAPITSAALRAGKHVLCEKPLGRNVDEAAAAVECARLNGRVLKTGFNHRHHPALHEAHRLCAAGVLGEVYFIKCLHGHGGRVGYEREWRGDATRSGGGDLLDQGVHLFDLSRWFVGDLVEVTGMIATHHWQIAPLEDNAFAILRSRTGAVVDLHTSWTYWKNEFSFMVLGRDGYLRVDGLGGSYGPERLIVASRQSDHSKPAETCTQFTGRDTSWALEWAEFAAAIADGREPLGSGVDGLEALRLVDATYRSAHTGQLVRVAPLNTDVAPVPAYAAHGCY